MAARSEAMSARSRRGALRTRMSAPRRPTGRSALDHAFRWRAISAARARMAARSEAAALVFVVVVVEPELVVCAPAGARPAPPAGAPPAGAGPAAPVDVEPVPPAIHGAGAV